MEPITRRNMLRVGGAAGASGVVGASLLGGTGLLAPTYAAPTSRIRARLDRRTYRPGDRMVLRVNEYLKQGRKIRVVDSTGLSWKRVAKSQRRQVWVARAAWSGPGAVTIVAVRTADGRAFRDQAFRDRVEYRVSGSTTSPLTGPALIGMSAPAGVWSQRVGEVGPGLAARRIFADLGKGATNQIKLVEQAHAAGMMPVISYKVGGDVAGAMSGRFNAVAEQAAAKLASYGLPTAVTFWHEPYGDMSGADYAAASKQILPIFKRGELRVGPLLNGWLLDNKLADFASYCPDELFALWDWVGIDTYESGSMEDPGNRKPADRVPVLAAYVKSRGYSLPLGVGEYNGYSGASITAVGEVLLSTPNVWFGCMWNSTEGKGIALTGERLEAFRQTLADPRSAQPR